MPTLRVRVDAGGRMPAGGKPGDAGLDLFVSEPVVIEPGQFVDVPCSVAVGLPAGWWGLITGRSSTMRSRGLLVTQGVIDTGYRGLLFAGVYNLSDEPVAVAAGERLAQLILLPNVRSRRVGRLRLRRVWQLGETVRGVGGFGSTGR